MHIAQTHKIGIVVRQQQLMAISFCRTVHKVLRYNYNSLSISPRPFHKLVLTIFSYSGAPVNQERWPQRQPQFSCLSWLAKKPKQTNVSVKRNRPQFHNVLSWPFLFWVHQQKTFTMGQRLYEVASVLSGILESKN